MQHFDHWRLKSLHDRLLTIDRLEARSAWRALNPNREAQLKFDVLVQRSFLQSAAQSTRILLHKFASVEEVTTEKDEKYMRMAMREAMNAYDADEVPIGCVIVCKGQVIARGYNLTERLHDFTAHAEMQAYTSASEFLNGKSLHECTLYVTLEPCVMCAGGAYNTRVGRIVFGAYDEKRGFSKFGNHQDNGQGIVHPRCEVLGGVLADDCAKLLTTFFRDKRD